MMTRQAGQAWKGIPAAACVALLSGCLVDIDLGGGHGHGRDHDRDRIRGSGISATTTRTVSGFSQVWVSGVGHLVVEQGDREALTITADDNLLPFLESRVVGTRLFLGPTDNVNLSPVRDIVYRLTVRELDRVSLSGTVTADVVELVTPRLTFDLSGVTSVDATGAAEVLHVDVSGTGRYWGPDFSSVRATVVASGASSVVVYARDRLDAVASGVSSIRFLGQPAVFASVSGSGTVGHY